MRLRTAAAAAFLLVLVCSSRANALFSESEAKATSQSQVMSARAGVSKIPKIQTDLGNFNNLLGGSLDLTSPNAPDLALPVSLSNGALQNDALIEPVAELEAPAVTIESFERPVNRGPLQSLIKFVSNIVRPSGKLAHNSRTADGAVSAFFDVREGTKDQSSEGPYEISYTPDEKKNIRNFREAVRSAVVIKNLEHARGSYSDEPAEWVRQFGLHVIGSGSGVVWDAMGHIVTNNHVLIKGGDKVAVFLRNPDTGMEWEGEATVVGRDPRSDIAVLKIEAPPELLHPIKLGNSDALQEAQDVLVIGNPYGFIFSVTRGIISALRRELSGIRGLIQTDAPVNPGNSGSMLIDKMGRLIGMMTMIFKGSEGSVGLGFAIPVNRLIRNVAMLIEEGRVRYPSMGIIPLEDDARYQFSGWPKIKGVIVGNVAPGYPASAAGIRGIEELAQIGAPSQNLSIPRIGDIITKIDTRTVRGRDDFLDILEEYRPGNLVTVEILREGKTIIRRIRLAEERPL